MNYGVLAYLLQMCYFIRVKRQSYLHHEKQITHGAF